MKPLAHINHDPRFPTINRYWSDPAYRRRIDAENAHARDLANQHIDTGMAELNAKQAEAWASENKGAAGE